MFSKGNKSETARINARKNDTYTQLQTVDEGSKLKQDDETQPLTGGYQNGGVPISSQVSRFASFCEDPNEQKEQRDAQKKKPYLGKADQGSFVRRSNKFVASLVF